MTVPGDMHVRGFGASGEQGSDLHVIAWDRFANFLEDGRGTLVVESLAQASALELMRHNAEKLNFAGGIRHRAVFFVSGGGGEDDVSDFGCVGQEHFLHDEEFQLAAA